MGALFLEGWQSLVYCTALEKRRMETYRGFESHAFLHFFVSVAQLVEQQSPKLLVAGSNPATYACGCSSVVEHLPSKQSVASPNLVTRSNRCTVVAKKPPQLSEARQSDNMYIAH